MLLSDRMKKYENVSKNVLMNKTPAIIRIDGKAFHTWTKGLDRPFDKKFYAAMAKTTIDLVNNIQNAVFAYGQSDEISIFLKDYENYNTESWFDGNIQKITSVSASMATAYFNKYANKMKIDQDKLAFFDSRVFTLPPHEVINYFIWRQNDFIRNSVESTARYYLGHKACHGLDKQGMIDALRQLDEPVDWYHDLDTIYRLGYTYVRGQDQINVNVPNFTECKEYIGIHI